MTYKELIEELQKLPADRLNDTVTVYDPDRDDFCGINHTSIALAEHNDVLDPGHLYLVTTSYGF
jgi:hypothetical protein